jgi:hypothetical protein
VFVAGARFENPPIAGTMTRVVLSDDRAIIITGASLGHALVRENPAIGHAFVRENPVPKTRIETSVKTCRVEGCGRLVDANGLCRPHRQREKQYGDPEAGPALPPRIGTRVPCKVPGCRNFATTTKALCPAHCMRLKRKGDVGLEDPLRQPRGKATHNTAKTQTLVKTTNDTSKPQVCFLAVTCPPEEALDSVKRFGTLIDEFIRWSGSEMPIQNPGDEEEFLRRFSEALRMSPQLPALLMVMVINRGGAYQWLDLREIIDRMMQGSTDPLKNSARPPTRGGLSVAGPSRDH